MNTLWPRSVSLSLYLCVLVCLLPATTAQGQLLQHTDPNLTSIFPAGGNRGAVVSVELRGVGVLAGENRILIDGPPGISASDVEFVQSGFVRAKLTIAADANPGRRMIRLHNVTHGATNFRYFFVGDLPEVSEQEPNSGAEQPQAFTIPTVINGRIQAALDSDWFTFAGRAGQPLVAAVLAHGMDSFVDYRKGFLDTSITLRDASGKTLAVAEDSVNVDPILHCTLPADGQYSVQIQSLNYEGSDHASYRLTLGDVRYATSAFPPGGQRGQSVELELAGVNFPNAERSAATIIESGTLPAQLWESSTANLVSHAIELVRGDFAECVETEPNDTAQQAKSLALPMTANGRFQSAGDEDWYQIELQQGAGVLLQTVSQRRLQSPADTEIRVFDSNGKQLAENDDGAAFGGYVQCAHDFVSSDSWLTFAAPAAGVYHVRVRDLNGTSGSQSVYRLSAEPLQPDFSLHQWPDAVPIWGPGTSATFIVEVLKWGGLDKDVEVSVVDLPAGWQGGVAYWPNAWYPGLNGNMAMKLLLTITAPADAPLGAVVPFRVIGRAQQGERLIEHEAQYLTLYGNSHNDRMHVRPSPQARAFVADYKDSWLATETTEVSGVDGQTVLVPLHIHRPRGETNPISIVANGATPSAGCGWGAPVALPNGVQEFLFPLKLDGHPSGDYSIVLARSWASDIRAGRPGPCTATIKLHILPTSAAK